jgi:hypothetical protein
VGQIIDSLFSVLNLPLELIDRIQHEPAVTAAALVLVVAVVWALLRYQRCPHCHRWVRRARGRWMRCSRCGRQYHRGLRGVK